MKKLLIVSALMFALALLMVGLASANAGPHGGYTATTDACAGCHRAHTASGAKLLVAADTYSLCMTCHGSTAAGAQTNVEDGVYARYNNAGTYTDKTTTGSEGTVGAALNGGGFAYAYDIDTGSFVATTSTHQVDGTITAAWGYGTANRGATGTLPTALTCASCHDPHGTQGYRLLKAGPTTAADDYDSAAKNYTDEAWGNAKLSAFCASCHTAYHETAANVGSDNTVWSYGNTYTHRVDMAFTYSGNQNPEIVGVTEGTTTYTLPLADGTNADEVVVCTTCHLPHGTSAAMTGYASGAGPAGDSALLRLDNRGVCEVCHQK